MSSIVVPKVERADQLATVSDRIEHSVAAPYGIRLEALIETARGVVNVEAIAGSTDKLDALIFGPGDYAASLGLPLADIGAIDPDYPGDQWAYPRARIAVAAHAFGLVPIDGPYARYRDIEGFRESAKRARALGFVGRWVIHPDQVGPCREAFGTSSDELVAAERTLDALRSTGVASIDDAMVDAVSARMAEQAVQRSRAGDG